MAEPVMFSATTTGPETPKTWPKCDSRSSSLILGRFCFAFGRAPAIMSRMGEVDTQRARARRTLDEQRHRLTRVVSFRYPLGSLHQSLPSQNGKRTKSASTRAYA